MGRRNGFDKEKGMDWRAKYLKCFFMWQEIYERACQRIKQLEAEIERLKNGHHS